MINNSKKGLAMRVYLSFGISCFLICLLVLGGFPLIPAIVIVGVVGFLSN